jgi:hypothetical protein
MLFLSNLYNFCQSQQKSESEFSFSVISERECRDRGLQLPSNLFAKNKTNVPIPKSVKTPVQQKMCGDASSKTVDKTPIQSSVIVRYFIYKIK